MIIFSLKSCCSNFYFIANGVLQLNSWTGWTNGPTLSRSCHMPIIQPHQPIGIVPILWQVVTVSLMPSTSMALLLGFIKTWLVSKTFFSPHTHHTTPYQPISIVPIVWQQCHLKLRTSWLISKTSLALVQLWHHSSEVSKNKDMENLTVDGKK